ncbi:MAG: hypothetical protein ACE5IY_15425 [bacterium]
MKQPIDLARRFLLLAEQDILAFHILIASEDVGDAQVGGNDQHAVRESGISRRTSVD